MTEEWKNAKGGDSKLVRWTEECDEEYKDKTVFVGNVVQGIYEDKREGVGKKKGVLYNISTEEHGLLSVWGSTVINNAFTKIPVGSEVKIEHKGERETKDGQGSYIDYEILYREAPMKSAVEEEKEVEVGEDLPDM